MKPGHEGTARRSGRAGTWQPSYACSDWSLISEKSEILKLVYHLFEDDARAAPPAQLRGVPASRTPRLLRLHHLRVHHSRAGRPGRPREPVRQPHRGGPPAPHIAWTSCHLVRRTTGERGGRGSGRRKATERGIQRGRRDKAGGLTNPRHPACGVCVLYLLRWKEPNLYAIVHARSLRNAVPLRCLFPSPPGRSAFSVSLYRSLESLRLSPSVESR